MNRVQEVFFLFFFFDTVKNPLHLTIFFSLSLLPKHLTGVLSFFFQPTKPVLIFSAIFHNQRKFDSSNILVTDSKELPTMHGPCHTCVNDATDN